MLTSGIHLVIIKNSMSINSPFSFFINILAFNSVPKPRISLIPYDLNSKSLKSPEIPTPLSLMDSLMRS